MNAPPGTSFPAFSSGDLAWIGVIGPGVCRESGRFETTLDQAVLRGFSTLIIDLSSCPRMDSSFVGVLLRLSQGSSLPDGSGPRLRIILNRPTEQVRELLDTLCLDQFFEIADMAVSDGMDQLPLEDRDLTKEEIMALSLDGHERLAAVNAGNAARFANLLGVLRKQVEALAPHSHGSRGPS
ncbi:MAG: STAS domain-containing protein [Limisphaerales bacterium]